MRDRHQLVVIGGGSAGLSVAFGAAYLGVDVAIVESGRFGGECTWTGCLPSKALLDVARRAHEARTGKAFGVEVGSVTVDFLRVMEHIKSISSHVHSHEDRPSLERAGVTVYEAAARFVSPNQIALDDGRIVRGERFVVATGSSPIVPPAIEDADPLTAETIWDLPELPETLLVVGGGAVGAELGQAFARLGSEVRIFTDEPRLLHRDHPDASLILESHLRREGVEINLSEMVIRASRSETGVTIKTRTGVSAGGTHLLFAVGQRPNLGDLHLASADVDLDGDGRAILDGKLRTTQRHISVIGDAAGAGFTHIAGDQAGTYLTNLLSPIDFEFLLAPRWATYTDPEIAVVGEVATSAETRSKWLTTRLRAPRIDRAHVDGSVEGFIEVLHTRLGKIRGVTIVGSNAAELGNQFVPLIGRRMTKLLNGRTIYPTMGSSRLIVGSEWAKQLISLPILGHFARLVIRTWVRILGWVKT